MATLPPSPFVGPSCVTAEPVTIYREPRSQFELDAALFMHAVDFPVDDPPPAFISDPSEEYVRHILHELAPTREAMARR